MRQRQAETAKDCRDQASGLALARLRGTGPVSGLMEEEKLGPENSCSGAPSLWAFFTSPQPPSVYIYFSSWKGHLEMQPLSGTDGRSTTQRGQQPGTGHIASKSQLWEQDLGFLAPRPALHTPKMPAHFRGKSACILTTFSLLTASYPETENLSGSPVCVSRGKESEGRTPCSEWVLRVISRWIHSLEIDVNIGLETKQGWKETKNMYLS